MREREQSRQFLDLGANQLINEAEEPRRGADVVSARPETGGGEGRGRKRWHQECPRKAAPSRRRGQASESVARTTAKHDWAPVCQHCPHCLS